MRYSFCQSGKMSFLKVGILHPPPSPSTKQRRKNFNCDYRDLGPGHNFSTQMSSTSWEVSQSKGQVGVSSRKRMVPTIFSWETKSTSVAKSLWLAARIKHISDKGTKGENMGSTGVGVWVGRPQYLPQSPCSFLYFLHLFSSSLRTHHSWKNQLEMRKFCNSQGKILWKRMNQKQNCIIV